MFQTHAIVNKKNVSFCPCAAVITIKTLFFLSIRSHTTQVYDKILIAKITYLPGLEVINLNLTKHLPKTSENP
jgi:hypothetical protein